MKERVFVCVCVRVYACTKHTSNNKDAMPKRRRWMGKNVLGFTIERQAS